jgi:site-specific recombinase XerD
MNARSVVLDWVSAMRAEGLAEATVVRRRATARRFADWIGGEGKLLVATSPQVDGWLSSLRCRDGRPIQPQSRAAYLKDLRKLYGWLARYEHVTRDPTARIPLPRSPRYRPRPIATSDLRTALGAADDRMRVILSLAAFAGLRAHEIAGLDGVDVDFDLRVLHVRGKGERDRVIPLHDELAAVLAGTGPGPVVRSAGNDVGGRVTARWVSTMVSRHFRRLNIASTAHPLRHWFGTMTYEACTDLRAVQELLGHSNPSTTAVYVAYSEERQRAAVNALRVTG